MQSATLINEREPSRERSDQSDDDKDEDDELACLSGSQRSLLHSEGDGNLSETSLSPIMGHLNNA